MFFFFMKSGVGVLYRKLFKKHEFYENRYFVVFIFLGDIKVILTQFL
jgi:hypothetical protein